MSRASDQGFILWSQNIDPALPDYILQTASEPNRVRGLKPELRRRWYGEFARTWAERSVVLVQTESWWISRSRSFAFGELTASLERDGGTEAAVTVFAPRRNSGPHMLLSALKELVRRMGAAVEEREASAFAVALVNLADGAGRVPPAYRRFAHEWTTS